MLRPAFVLVLLIHACAGDETVSGFAGEGAGFALETLDGAPPPGRLWISFPEVGAVAGIAPCNRFTAEQPVPYPWIAFDNLTLSEPVACDADARAVQDGLLAALVSMSLVETLGDALILSNDDGREMVFRGTAPADGL